MDVWVVWTTWMRVDCWRKASWCGICILFETSYRNERRIWGTVCWPVAYCPLTVYWLHACCSWSGWWIQMCFTKAPETWGQCMCDEGLSAKCGRLFKDSYFLSYVKQVTHVGWIVEDANDWIANTQPTCVVSCRSLSLYKDIRIEVIYGRRCWRGVKYFPWYGTTSSSDSMWNAADIGVNHEDSSVVINS